MSKGLIIIPAYNEEKNIGSVLKNIKGLNLGLDMVVVNDGSKDRTKGAVKAEKVDVISHLYNLGYGGALQTGFKYANSKGYDYVILFDADGQHDVKYLPKMKEEIEKGDVDAITGSRFLGEGQFKPGVLKGSVIKLMRFLIKLATNKKITDPTSGFKGLSKRVYSYYAVMGNFPSDYPDADIIIHMLRLKYRMREIPISINQRNSGKSMHSGIKPLIYILKMLLSIFIVLLRELFRKEE